MSKYGVGGMKSKLEAAEIATKSGVMVVIMSYKNFAKYGLPECQKIKKNK